LGHVTPKPLGTETSESEANKQAAEENDLIDQKPCPAWPEPILTQKPPDEERRFRQRSSKTVIHDVRRRVRPVHEIRDKAGNEYGDEEHNTEHADDLPDS